MIVIETSALIEFLVGSDPVAEQVRDFASTSRLAAPHGVDLACASTLRGLVLGSKLPADEAKRALTILRRMRLRRHDAAPLLPRIWQLRANMWPYDAAFAALAEALDVPLLTVDGKFQRTRGCAVTSTTSPRTQADPTGHMVFAKASRPTQWKSSSAKTRPLSIPA